MLLRRIAKDKTSFLSWYKRYDFNAASFLEFIFATHFHSIM